MLPWNTCLVTNSHRITEPTLLPAASPLLVSYTANPLVVAEDEDVAFAVGSRRHGMHG
jgi:hypothetical protein